MEKKCGNILVIIFSSDHLCGYYNEPNLPNFKSPKYMRSLWTKWSEHIEVCKKKRLLLIEAKKNICTSVALSPFHEKIYFSGRTWLSNWTICSCWNENEHRFEIFPPVEISFFLGRENPSSLDSFSTTWVK